MQYVSLKVGYVKKNWVQFVLVKVDRFDTVDCWYWRIILRKFLSNFTDREK